MNEKHSSDAVIIYRPYKVINGKKIYPKKAKVFKMLLRRKSA